MNGIVRTMTDDNETGRAPQAVNGDEFDIRSCLGFSWPADHETAVQWIQEGKDPFEGDIFIFESGFHDTSKRMDLHLLLVMAAEPGSLWTKRFLFCRNKEIDVPVHGRKCIPSASSGHGNFFHAGLSIEGIEVMVMYGYKIKGRDIEHICMEVAVDPPRFLSILMFALAHALQYSDFQAETLDQCLGVAVGGIHCAFFNGSQPSSLALAKLLLQAGANPNGYCFQGNTPYDFTPALYQAIKNRDGEMVELLMQFGADTTKLVQTSEWTEDGELDIQEFPIADLATENGLSNLLTPPEDPIIANPEQLRHTLYNQISQPLRKLYSGQIAVTMMRSTGQVPPFGVVTSQILSYCNLLRYDLDDKVV